MNTYYKYCPNVYLARCDQEYKKGDTVMVETKYGKENECVVHNLIAQKDGFFFYSVTRSDGYNSQERAKNKIERLTELSEKAKERSDEYYERSNKDKDFLSLMEPIKVGHHSEKRHRGIIDKAWNNMGKSVEYLDKAKEYENRTGYWQDRSQKIDLSMPESVYHFQKQKELCEEKYAKLKADKEARIHSYSLTYAKKQLNEVIKSLEIAQKLWS